MKNSIASTLLALATSMSFASGLSSEYTSANWTNLWQLELADSVGELAEGETQKSVLLHDMYSNATMVNTKSDQGFYDFYQVKQVLSDGSTRLGFQAVSNDNMTSSLKMYAKAQYDFSDYEYGKSVVKISADMNMVKKSGDTWSGFGLGGEINSGRDAPFAIFYNERTQMWSGGGTNDNKEAKWYGKNMGDKDISIELVVDTTKQVDDEGSSHFAYFEMSIVDADNNTILTRNGFIDPNVTFNPTIFTFGEYFGNAGQGKDDGSIWWGASVDYYNIPEPATYASILGALAIAFALMRRQTRK